MPLLLQCAVLCLLAPMLVCAQQSMYSQIDGRGNNINNPSWGATLDLLPRGGNYTAYTFSGPSARNITNLAFGTGNPQPGSGCNALCNLIGKLILIDIVGFDTSAVNVSSLPVPTCDIDYDPQCFGNATIPVNSSAVYFDSTGAPFYKNTVTAFVDASFLYGSDATTLASLRSYKQGQLALDVRGLLPTINSTSTNIPNPLPKRLIFQAGDLRINENAGLQALTTLFAREHNRKAAELAQTYKHWTDEILFQEARRWVIAIWQNTAFSLYPATTKGKTLTAYTAYNSSVKPTVSLAAALALSYITDAKMPSEQLVLESSKASSRTTYISLRDSYYNIEFVLSNGIDNIILGMFYQNSLSLNPPFVARDLRTYNGPIKRDTFAAAISRAREAGLPFYNTLRTSVGLPTFSTFASANFSVPNLSSLYSGSISQLDALVGMLAEQPVIPGGYGPLAAGLLYSQLLTLRNADRFYHMSSKSYFTTDQILAVQKYHISDLVESNTNVIPPVSMFNVATRVVDNSLLSDSCANAAKPNFVTLCPGYALNWTVSSYFITFEITNSLGPGFFAIGLGKLMSGSDIMFFILYPNGTVTYNDYYSKNYGLLSDVALGGTNDIINFKNLGTYRDGSVHIQFDRLLYTGDIYDTAISLDVPTNMIFAHYPSTTPQFHGPSNAGSFVATFSLLSNSNTNFTAGITAATYRYFWNFPPQAFHGFFMLGTTSVLIPLAALQARFTSSHITWLTNHVKIAHLGAIILLLNYFLPVFASRNINSLHGNLGTAVIVILLLTIGMGFVPVSGKNWRLYAVFHKFHVIFGYTLIPLSLACSYLGITNLIEKNSDYEAIYFMLTAWIFMMLFFMGTMEMNRRSQRKAEEARMRGEHSEIALKKLENKYSPVSTSASDYNNSSLSTILDAKTLKVELIEKWHLLEFSWNDIFTRVASGELLMVVDDAVIAISGVAHLHPGGLEPIYPLCGCDATKYFHGYDVIPNNKDIAKTRDSKKTRESDFTTSMLIHKHSRLASLMLLEHAIGVLNPDTVTYVAREEPERNWIPEIAPEDTALATNRPAIAKLVDVVDLGNGSWARPVIRLCFHFESADARLWTLPGEHVDIQVAALGGLNLRSYIPLRSYYKGKVEFLVRIHNDGVVTPVLQKLRPGALVAMHSSHVSKQVLMNRDAEYGLYDNLVILAAGTGASLATQTVDYYLRFGRVGKTPKLRVKVLVLLFVDTVEELELAKDLHIMASESDNAIKILPVVRHPNEMWNNEKGEISVDLAMKYLPQPKNLAQLKEAPKLGSGKISLTVEKKVEKMSTLSEFQETEEIERSRGNITESSMVYVCGPVEFNNATKGVLTTIGYEDTEYHVFE